MTLIYLTLSAMVVTGVLSVIGDFAIQAIFEISYMLKRCGPRPFRMVSVVDSFLGGALFGFWGVVILFSGMTLYYAFTGQMELRKVWWGI